MNHFKVVLTFVVLITAHESNGQFSTIINVPPDAAPESLSSDTQLNLADGGILTGVLSDPNNPDSNRVFHAGSPDGTSDNVELNITGGEAGFLDVYAGATLNMSGGNVEDFFTLDGGVVNFSGGAAGIPLAFDGSTVNISGDSIADQFYAYTGSTVNVSGGIVKFGFFARNGSTLNISGGQLGEFGGHASNGLVAESGSVIDVSGGVFVDGFLTEPGSAVSASGGVFESNGSQFLGGSTDFVGGEFRLNGAPYVGPEITLNGDDVFTGTFADGTPFLFDRTATLQSVALTPVSLPPISADPIIVDGTGASHPSGLRPGQTLILKDGGTLDDFFLTLDATLNIEGGETGRIKAYNSTVSVSGGSVGDFVGGRILALNGSTVNIFDGSIGAISAFSGEGATINLMGGTVGGFSFLGSGNTANISGGILDTFNAQPGSIVNIFGTDFSLDGVPVDLQFGVPTTINLRNAVLTGTLVDGSAIELVLSEVVSEDAKLAVTLVPEPTAETLLVLSSLALAVTGRRNAH